MRGTGAIGLGDDSYCRRNLAFPSAAVGSGAGGRVLVAVLLTFRDSGYDVSSCLIPLGPLAQPSAAKEPAVGALLTQYRSYQLAHVCYPLIDPGEPDPIDNQLLGE